MFSVIRNNLWGFGQRYFSSATNSGLKVTLCGAAGHTGQAIALLLKSCPLLDELALYDIVSTAGIALELSHIDTNCKVTSNKRDLPQALKNANIVVITAAAPRPSPFQDCFHPNADILSEIVNTFACTCPKALLAIATEPVNSLVPFASEILKSYGVYSEKHVFGITTLNVMRTNSIVAKRLGLPPENVHVPVIGGNSKTTVVPLLSQTKPYTNFALEELEQITDDVQTTTAQLFNNYKPYLAGAVGVAQFVIALIRGMKGEERVVENCYVRSKAYPNLDYLSTPIILGNDGVQKNLGVPEMTHYEKCLFQSCRETLFDDIQQGECYAHSKCRK